MVNQVVPQLIFHKKEHPSSIISNTFTHIVSTSFMNSKNLCPRMEEEIILAHIQMIVFII